MTTQKRYHAVADTVRDVTGDENLAASVERHIAERRLIMALTAQRVKVGLSQQEVATKISCTQSKVSKLESGKDADCPLGQLVQYAIAVGANIRLFLVPHGQKRVDQVKMYAALIQRLLHEMVDLAGDDLHMCDGVQKFMTEASYNLGKIVEGAEARLPTQTREPEAEPLQVEAQEMEPPYHEETKTQSRKDRAPLPAGT